MKYRQAEACATTDALTGLPNARSLFLHLDREIARSKRQHSALTVLVCDLDGFKQVNDRFGHLEGNKLLRYLWAEATMRAVEKRFYRRILVQKGMGKARIAVARKLGIRLWSMLRKVLPPRTVAAGGESPSIEVLTF